MASLSCINNIFEPGNIGSSSGEIAPTPTGEVKFPITVFAFGIGRGASYGFAVGTTGSDKAGRMSLGSWGYGVGASYHEATGYGAGASYGRGAPGGGATFDSTAITFDATDHTFDETA